jgi:hypothetical protein
MSASVIGPGLFILGCFFAAFGALVLYQCLKLLRKASSLLREGVVTMGDYRGNAKVVFVPDGASIAPLSVRFTRSCSIGDKIPVVYDPQHPVKALPATVDMLFYPSFYLSPGCLWMIAGLELMLVQNVDLAVILLATSIPLMIATVPITFWLFKRTRVAKMARKLRKQ